MSASAKPRHAPPRLRTLGAILLGPVLVTAACGGGEGEPPVAEPGPEPIGGAVTPSVDPAAFDTADIDGIRERGWIRFGNVARAQLDEVPHLHWGAPSEDAVIRAFATRMGLEPEIHDYPDVHAATDALLDGRVDVILGRRGAGIAPPPDEIAFSRPFRVEPGTFLARAGAAPDSLRDLDGRTVSFGYEDGMIGFGAELVASSPRVTVDTLELVTVEDAVDRLRSGEIDVTLAERWVAESLVEIHPELEMGMEFGSITYAAEVRASNPDLLRLLNDFAFEALPVGLDAPPLHGDLPEIHQRRVLRVLTVNGPSTYYVHRGDVVGFDLELIHRFAAEQGLILQMVVAPSVDELIPWLRRGLGDMIGAGVHPVAFTDTAGVSFTRPYHDVRPVLVAPGWTGVSAEADLSGRTVLVGRNSPFLPVMEAARDSMGFELTITSDAESLTQLLDRLERREAHATVLESHLTEVALEGRDSLRVVHAYDHVPGRSWVVRDVQPELLAALDDFLDRERRGPVIPVLERKYFLPDTRLTRHPELPGEGSISPWDDLVREHAGLHDMDWRMVTAQMFVESRFDPEAESHAGAYGLMQMMPATARQMGVTDLRDPREQVRSGVAYLRWLYDRLSDDLALDDRLAFSFAAYNAGFGHLRDARRVAELNGLDPDRWFGNVEMAMLSLSDPEVYRNTRHGFVHGEEPVRYVRRINELGLMYFRLVPR